MAHGMTCVRALAPVRCVHEESPKEKYLVGATSSTPSHMFARLHISPDIARLSHVVGAGDYDYDDEHNLPAGCQYLDPQSSETIDTSSNSASAQAPGPAGADGSGHVSAPAPAPGSAAASAAAPVQATPPSANAGRRAVLSVSPSRFAPAPAPGMAPGNATSANATGGAAQSGGTADMQGQGNLLCRPIAAKEDAPSGMSRNTKIIIGVVVPVGVLLVVFCIWCACRR